MSKAIDSPSVSSSEIMCSLPIDDEDFAYIAKLFVERLFEQIENMATALNSNDFDELCEIGHWLKGAGGTAGFAIFTTEGEKLEASAESKDVAQTQKRIDEILNLARRVKI